MSISLKNVSYSYKGKYQTVRAVDGVSYDFEPGKCYAIIGKSIKFVSKSMALLPHIFAAYNPCFTPLPFRSPRGSYTTAANAEVYSQPSPAEKVSRECATDKEIIFLQIICGKITLQKSYSINNMSSKRCYPNPPSPPREGYRRSRLAQRQKPLRNHRHYR